MTSPCKPDPVTAVLEIVVGAMIEVFDPEQACPPRGGGSDTVRIFAGDATPLSAWDAHTSGGSNCSQPFIWVRPMRRYRSKVFPNPTLGIDCELTRVVPIEIGVGRCAVTDEHPKWSQWAEESAISQSDAHRIEGALCIATSRLTDEGRSAGSDIINPYGPEGGIVAQIANLYASY